MCPEGIPLGEKICLSVYLRLLLTSPWACTVIVKLLKYPSLCLFVSGHLQESDQGGSDEESYTTSATPEENVGVVR